MGGRSKFNHYVLVLFLQIFRGLSLELKDIVIWKRKFLKKRRGWVLLDIRSPTSELWDAHLLYDLSHCALMAHNAWERATKNCPKWSGTKAKVDLWKLSSDPGSQLLFPEIKATKISFVPLYTIMGPIIYFFDGWSLSTDIFYSASA